jgi:3-isopropylmalate/(R)-2-methylmalate dehydratase small subunit
MNLEGLVWKIERDGRLIDDIDTDMIYHNRHLHVTDREEMARYAFGNLDGWQDFPDRARQDDIIIVGENFGCGSSRQHAVDCFLALGIQAIIARSFGAIYKRNAINSALAILEWPELDEKAVRTGDALCFDPTTGEITTTAGIAVGTAKPMSPVQAAIYKAGGLFAYARSI